MDDYFNRHERIALQFSGGKDSLACLYLLRPCLDRITVYWLNSGNPFPETEALMANVRKMCPHFEEVRSDVQGVHEQYGIPSDIVPATSTMFGRIVAGDNRPVIQDRYSCCFLTRMKPMHERMIEDGITLVIRGQRNDDKLRAPIKSGYVEDMGEYGMEYLFPIEDWTEHQVLTYLREQDAPVPRFYEIMDSMPDCMGCSAYWDENRAAYLKRYHHEAYKAYQAKLDVIKQAVAPHIASFNEEINT